MKNILLGILCSASFLTTCAQSTGKLKKAYAYYTVSMPGMQMVDENGNPVTPKPSISRIIYFEWNGVKKPAIDAILYNKQVLIATLIPVEGKTVVPGSDLSQNNISKITVAKQNSLWRMDLQPKEGNVMPDQDCKNIIIKIKESKKTFSYKLTRETLLQTLPRY
jgi:hypothetical protein